MRIKAIHRIGQRFGRLLVTGLAPKVTRNSRLVCHCDCGGEVIVSLGNLVHGATRSCGCLHIEMLVARSTTHGMTQGGKPTPEYEAWSGLRKRCNNELSPDFPNYGGRGISVCQEWGDFSVFLTDMGARPEGASIDRIDNDLGYCKSNCRWATPAEQARNRRNSIHIEHLGRRMALAAWAAELGIARHTMYSRYRKGERGARLFRGAK